MTRQDKFPATTASPLLHGGNTAGADGSPVSAPATCPDCDGPFSYRIRDEDTGCSYPVDDGEHYCGPCDALWTDAELIAPSPRISNQPTYEEAVALIAEVFGPKPVSNGSWRIEL